MARNLTCKIETRTIPFDHGQIFKNQSQKERNILWDKLGNPESKFKTSKKYSFGYG
jgi:hypothetical protein